MVGRTDRRRRGFRAYHRGAAGERRRGAGGLVGKLGRLGLGARRSRARPRPPALRGSDARRSTAAAGLPPISRDRCLWLERPERCARILRRAARGGERNPRATPKRSWRLGKAQRLVAARGTGERRRGSGDRRGAGGVAAVAQRTARQFHRGVAVPQPRRRPAAELFLRRPSRGNPRAPRQRRPFGGGSADLVQPVPRRS